MPEYENDPAGNTQQFRAYVQRGAAEPAAKRGNAGVVIGAVVAVVIVAAVVILAITVL
jgi:hypothetical protein